MFGDDEQALPAGCGVGGRLAFQGASCGGACTDLNDPGCSCTAGTSVGYWSASTHATNSGLAWVVAFSDGFVDPDSKPGVTASVRAVRGGS